MTKQDKLKRCVGCRANRYNMPAGWRETANDSPVDGTGCWHLDIAKPCHKLIYYSPGDYVRSIRLDTLTCWHNNVSSGTICDKNGKPK